MAFERRESAGLDYYAAARDPATGEVRKRYPGRGESADTAAAELAARRDRREGDRRELLKAQGASRDAELLTGQLDRAAATLLKAALFVGGWHRPNTGPRRRRRGR